MYSRQIPAAASCTPYYPFPRGKSILGVTYGFLLWADMNAATPLGAWGRSVIAVGTVVRDVIFIDTPRHTLRPWLCVVWYGMVEVCEGAPVAVSGWVLTVL